MKVANCKPKQIKRNGNFGNFGKFFYPIVYVWSIFDVHLATFAKLAFENLPKTRQKLPKLTSVELLNT